MTDDAGKVDISIVKVLRQKCDDLEEELDLAVEAKKEAIAAKAELEQELSNLKEQLKALEKRDAHPQGSSDHSELEKLIAAVAAADQTVAVQRQELEELQARCKEQTECAQKNEQAVRKELEDWKAKNTEQVDLLQKHEEALRKELEELQAKFAKDVDSAQQKEEALKLKLEELQANSRDAAEAARKHAEALKKDIEDLKAKSNGDLSVAFKKAEEAQKAQAEVQQQLQERQRSKENLEALLAASEQNLKDRNTALAAQGDDRVYILQSALMEEQERRAKLQQAHDALESSKQQLERKLQQQTQCLEAELRPELTKAQRLIQDLTLQKDEAARRLSSAEERCASSQEQEELAQTQLNRLQAEMEQHRRQAAEELEKCSKELTYQRDEALHKLAAAEEQQASLREQEHLARSQLESFQNELEQLKRQSAATLEENSNALLAEKVTLETKLHSSEETQVELARRLEETLATCEELASDRNEALERLQRAESSLNDTREEMVIVQRAMAEAKRRTAELNEGLEAERRARASDTANREHLQVQMERLHSELQGKNDAISRMQAEIARITEAFKLERQRSQEMQDNLDAVKPMHEELFTRYSSAVEQLDSLKSEKEAFRKDAERLSAEHQQLSRALEEEQQRSVQALQELQVAEAASTQLTVNDVLISITFDDTPAPLELKPWDTNFEDVVMSWLLSVKRSEKLKQSLVRYLKHLEETCEAFPVRKKANLLEVHEEFALA